jgi:hypothetical protein
MAADDRIGALEMRVERLETWVRVSLQLDS